MLVGSCLAGIAFLKGLGMVPADCAQRIVEKAIQDSAAGTNPRPATVTEIRKLIEEAIAKAR